MALVQLHHSSRNRTRRLFRTSRRTTLFNNNPPKFITLNPCSIPRKVPSDCGFVQPKLDDPGDPVWVYVGNELSCPSGLGCRYRNGVWMFGCDCAECVDHVA